MFFGVENFFRSIPRAHLFENLRFDIFKGFIADFRFPAFENFQRKKRFQKMFGRNFFWRQKILQINPEGTPFRKFEI